MYIIPMYLRLTPFTKTLPQIYFFVIFISLWGPPMTLLTVGALTAQTCARLMQGRVASAGWPPNKNPGYALRTCQNTTSYRFFFYRPPHQGPSQQILHKFLPNAFISIPPTCPPSSNYPFLCLSCMWRIAYDIPHKVKLPRTPVSSTMSRLCSNDPLWVLG